MSSTNSWGMRISSLSILVVLWSHAGLAQTKPAAKGGASADELVIHDYILTMDKIKAYSAFSQKAQSAAQADPALAAEMQKISEADVSNVDKVAMIEKAPHVSAYFKNNGMTPKDFVFTPMTALTAALAMAAEDAKKQPPNYINPVNIKFVRDHKAELEKMSLIG
jgi:hypothetical protein